MNISAQKFVPLLLLLCWFRVAAASEWIIGFDGLGPIKIGMTTAQVIKAKGKLKLSPDGDRFYPEITSCYGVYIPNSHLYLQFDQGKLEEINISSQKFKTVAGVGVGSTFADIVRVFGKERLLIGSNHYDDDVPQVTIEAPMKIRKHHPNMHVGIKFEFEPGPLVGTSRITGVSIGAHYVEGCA